MIFPQFFYLPEKNKTGMSVCFDGPREKSLPIHLGNQQENRRRKGFFTFLLQHPLLSLCRKHRSSLNLIRSQNRPQIRRIKNRRPGNCGKKQQLVSFCWEC